MHPLLAKFFNEKENEQRKKDYAKRTELLISNGLCEKIYSQDNVYSPEFQHFDSEANRWYRLQPIEVTDEELERIKKYSTVVEYSEKPSNGVATAIRVIAVITFILGFIVGIAAGMVDVGYRDTEFYFSVALTYWVVTAVSGIMLLGFAEIISLLNDIKNK